MQYIVVKISKKVQISLSSKTWNTLETSGKWRAHEGVARDMDYAEKHCLSEQPVKLEYPVLQYPEKIKSLNFDKDPKVIGTLTGIKGQYLMLDQNRALIKPRGMQFLCAGSPSWLHPSWLLSVQ